MKRLTKKTFYRRQLADRRRKRRRVLTPRRIPTHFLSFHGLDEDFCARTILPRIASRDERVSLDKRLVIAMPREYLNDFGPSAKNNMLLDFADNMEQSLSEMLSRSVRDFHHGHSAGYCSHSYDLGTKDEPIRLNPANALNIGATLAFCGQEVPQTRCGDFALLVPPFMADMILAKGSELKFSDPFPIPPKHIRFGVGELGNLMDNYLFIDEAITGQNAAYAIRVGAILWNFKFMYNDDHAHNSLLIELRYGFCIPDPDYIVKMEVSNG